MYVPHEKLLIRPEIADSESGGLHIPDQAKEAPARGIALLVGEEVENWVAVEAGDTVYYNRYAGAVVSIVMPDTAPRVECAECGGIQGKVPDVCERARDEVTREPTFKHVWMPPKVVPEELLVIDSRDVVLVDEDGSDIVGEDDG